MRKETTQKTYELNYLVNKYFHRQKKLALLCKNISLTVSRWENLHYIVQMIVFRDDRKIIQRYQTLIVVYMNIMHLEF